VYKKKITQFAFRTMKHDVKIKPNLFLGSVSLKPFNNLIRDRKTQETQMCISLIQQIRS